MTNIKMEDVFKYTVGNKLNAFLTNSLKPSDDGLDFIKKLGGAWGKKDDMAPGQIDRTNGFRANF